MLPELLARGVPVDIVTDQTSAHDPLSYLPAGVELADWHAYAQSKPEEFTERARASMAKHVAAMVGFLDAGAEVFDYGNSIRGEAQLAGYERAFDFPGFVPAYIRPLFCEGKGPFRWAALSGDPADIAATDRAVLDLFPDDEPLARWIRRAGERVAFQGLPARICWLGYGERHQAGLRFNEMVADGRLSAPIVIGRDHLDCGSVASPYRETEAMLDGSDAIADWPLLNALVNTASGASWVSIHHGGGVGIGRSIHAGQVSRRRRHRAGRREARAGADERPRAWASCGTSTPATTSPSRWRPSAASACRWPRAEHHRRRRRQDGSHRGRHRAFRSLWEPLLPLGRDQRTGGYRRYAWTAADAACRDWFRGAAAERGMDVDTDRNGNLWAWWGRPAPDALVIGSHLDSVPDGGAYDGPLGVVSAFAALDLVAAATGRRPPPRRPVAVVAFADEEGARFGVACVGSRLLTGALDPDRARALTDADGTTLAEALRAAGHDPARLGRDDEALGRVGRFVELHVEQGRRLVDVGAPVGVATAIWPHGRYRFTFTGEANHAGTTRLEDRRDPMLTYAETVLAARKKARLADARVTFGRVEVEPNGTNAIPSTVRAWLDARAADEAGARRPGRVHRPRRARARRPGRHRRSRSSRSRCRRSSPSTRGLTGRVAAAARLADAAAPVPRIPTQAGHDAGVLAAHVPAAMLFVRNPTGVSHSPAEHADEADCLAGVAGAGPGRRGRGARAGRAVSAYLCEHAWLGGPTVAATTSSSRSTAAASPPSRRAFTGAAPRGVVRLPGLTRARAGQRALARLPPRAARAHACGGPRRRGRLVLDLARADVRASPSGSTRRRTSRSRPPCTPRWRWPASPRSASSTTCTTDRAAGRTTTRTRWAHALVEAARDARAYGSRCWTPAT